METPAPGGLRALDGRDRELVRQCLRAAVEGPFFPDWEFHTLFGLTRGEVAAVLSRWPAVDDAATDVDLAVNNTLNNVLGYPHGCDTEWSDFIDGSREDVARVFAKWRGDAPQRYFDGMK